MASIRAARVARERPLQPARMVRRSLREPSLAPLRPGFHPRRNAHHHDHIFGGWSWLEQLGHRGPGTLLLSREPREERARALQLRHLGLPVRALEHQYDRHLG